MLRIRLSIRLRLLHCVLQSVCRDGRVGNKPIRAVLILQVWQTGTDGEFPCAANTDPRHFGQVETTAVPRQSGAAAYAFAYPDNAYPL